MSFCVLDMPYSKSWVLAPQSTPRQKSFLSLRLCYGVLVIFILSVISLVVMETITDFHVINRGPQLDTNGGGGCNYNYKGGGGGIPLSPCPVMHKPLL